MTEPTGIPTEDPFDDELARRLQAPTLGERLKGLIGRVAGRFIMPEVDVPPIDQEAVKAYRQACEQTPGQVKASVERFREQREKEKNRPKGIRARLSARLMEVLGR